MTRTRVGVLLAAAVLGSPGVSGTETTATPSLCLELWDRAPVPDTAGVEEAVEVHLTESRNEAEDALRSPGVRESSAVEATGLLARTYHAYGLDEAADAAYGVARCLDPRDPLWPYAQGRLAEARGDLGAAELLYFDALREDSRLPVRFRLAEIAMTRGDLTRAELLYRQALDEPPSRVAALAALGQIALSRGEDARAVELFEAALEAVPDAVRLHYPLALAHRRLGNHAEAAEHLEKNGPVGVAPADPLQESLEAIPRGSRILVLRGKAALRAGRPEEAAGLLAQAVVQDPTSTSARIALAVASSRLGDFARARKQLERAVELEPENPTALFNLAVLDLREGHRARARQLLERVLTADPGDEEARRLLESVD